jgi:hypothetical protein
MRARNVRGRFGSVLDVDNLRKELKDISVSVRDALVAAGHIVYDPRDNSIAFCSGSMLPALDCISKTLFDVMDFKGNQQDYYDPKNRCCVGAQGLRESCLYGIVFCLFAQLSG